jgi:hypothetical protein
MSTKLTVERFAYTDMGTFGRMSVDGQTLYTGRSSFFQSLGPVSV